MKNRRAHGGAGSAATPLGDAPPPPASHTELPASRLKLPYFPFFFLFFCPTTCRFPSGGRGQRDPRPAPTRRGTARHGPVPPRRSSRPAPPRAVPPRLRSPPAAPHAGPIPGRPAVRQPPAAASRAPGTAARAARARPPRNAATPQLRDAARPAHRRRRGTAAARGRRCGAAVPCCRPRGSSEGQAGAARASTSVM